MYQVKQPNEDVKSKNGIEKKKPEKKKEKPYIKFI
jgi:hypothetical protein